MNPCCRCDGPVHVCVPDIAAGLSSLPRQQNGFPEYRLAMLRDIPRHAPLAAWRAREGDDLGIMLLEMWAYVLDILGFYDERLANETYLRTAVLSPSLRRLVGLISYRARPALGASAILAVLADGHKPVVMSPRTAFRSDAFGAEPPQVFETEVPFTVHPLKNEWTIAPVRATSGGGDLLLDPAGAALGRDQIAVLRAGAVLHAGHVSSLDAIQARDGRRYKKLVLDPAPALPDSLPVERIEVLTPGRSAAVRAVAGPLIAAAFSTSSASAHVAAPRRGDVLTLDALYPELSESDTILVARGRVLHASTITEIATVDVIVNPGTDSIPAGSLPATRVTIGPPIPASWAGDPRRLTVHFAMNRAGVLTRVAKTELNTPDFAPPGLPLDGALEPLPPDAAKPGELLLLDAHDAGALANGTVDIDQKGAGRVQFSAGRAPLAPPLRTPVTVFGNLVAVTRGESVVGEVLGSGDASQVFQSFTLAKHPLTYLNDAASPSGRRTTLEVRVNGILWKEASSFFGASPISEIYTVRQNDAGESIVRFGDGVTGARLPTGVDNVIATYRFGAGAAKPPAGAIGQLARPVEGLRRVVNPVGAGGGADADRPKDIRRNAPHSALILGRAISIPDFDALAREFGGVVNAQTTWAWAERTQNAAVYVSFISDGGDIAAKLRAFLLGFAAPNTPIVAVEATPRVSTLAIDLEIDPRFDRKAVAGRVKQALTDPEAGLLALENIPIGQPLFRSRLFEAVLAVEGTQSVRALTVNGLSAPFAIMAGPDRYLDFRNGLVVG
jgi:hypothetical protein